MHEQVGSLLSPFSGQSIALESKPGAHAGEMAHYIALNLPFTPPLLTFPQDQGIRATTCAYN